MNLAEFLHFDFERNLNSHFYFDHKIYSIDYPKSIEKECYWASLS